MVNSYMKAEEVRKELNRLLLIRASVECELLSFCYGNPCTRSIAEIENEIFFLNAQIKDAENMIVRKS